MRAMPSASAVRASADDDGGDLIHGKVHIHPEIPSPLDICPPAEPVRSPPTELAHSVGSPCRAGAARGSPRRGTAAGGGLICRCGAPPPLRVREEFLWHC